MTRKDDYSELEAEHEQLKLQHQELETQYQQTLKRLEVVNKSRTQGWAYVRELEETEKVKLEQDELIPQLKLEIVELKEKIKRLQQKKRIFPKGESINIRLPEGMRAKILEACPNISHFIRDAVNLQLNVKQTPQCE